MGTITVAPNIPASRRGDLFGERPVIFRKVARRFEQLYTVKTGRLESGREFVPEGDYEVLRRGNDPAQKSDFLIQVPMVAAVDHGRVHNLLQLTEVDQVTSLRIRSAADRDLENVGVAVPVRVRAEPLWSDIPTRALGWIVEPMGRIEVHRPCDRENARLNTGCERMAWSGFFGHGFSGVRN